MDAPGAGLSARPPRAVVRSAVRAAVSDLAAGDHVLVALSGGPDSLALVAATVRVAAEAGLGCRAVVVDHGLQAGSGQVAARAVEQARLLGCSQVDLATVEVADGPGSGGPEAAARAARYRALDAAADDPHRPPVAAILLGHTRDDQAETVLLGLARGSGLRSLAGMAARSGRYRRPLLEVPRWVVRAAADAEASRDPRLIPWSDPHNNDERFARARLRAQVLPDLEAALGPGVCAGLVRTAALARQDADALDGWSDAMWAQLRVEGAIRLAADGIGEVADPGSLACLAVSALVRRDGSSDADRHSPGAASRDVPIAIQARIVRRLLLAAGCPAGALTHEHVRAVAALLAGPQAARAVVALPAGRQARREGADILVRV